MNLIKTLSFLLACLLSAPVTATNILLIDLSGSMEKDHKATRALAVARDVLPELVQTGPTAVWAFGSPSCGMLRSRSTPSTDLVAQQRLLAQLGGPKGHTPLSWSLREALTALKHSSEPRNLIIVSDGADSCGEDPCLTARQAGAKQAHITFYTVGVGMTTRNRDFKVLECVAGEGAANSIAVTAEVSQLSAVIEKIKDDIQREATRQAQSTLLVNVQDARGEPARLRFTVRDDHGNAHQGESGRPLTLPPGRYALSDPLPHTQTVVLAPGAQKQVLFKIPLGLLKTVSRCGDDLSITVSDPENRIVGTGNVGDEGLELPPGEYWLMLNRYPQRTPLSVTVVANRIQTVDLGGFGRVTVSATDAQGQSLKFPLAFYDDQDTRGNRATPVLNGETGLSLQLPAGIYNVQIAEESAPSSLLRGGENLSVTACQNQAVTLHQAAALRVCGDEGFVALHHDETGDRIRIPVNSLIPVEPGAVYNLQWPDGQEQWNQKMVRGLNQVNCPTGGK